MYKFLLILLILSLTFCSTKNNKPNHYSESYIKSPANINEAYEEELRARELARSNNNEQAIKIYSELINKYPNYNHLYRLYTGRAISYHKMKKINEALSDYLKAIDIYPYYINAYISLGLLYKHIGEKVKAKHIFNECIKILPDKKKEFEALINSLNPFIFAEKNGNDIFYIYKYNNMNFLIKHLIDYNVETKDNPYYPIMLYKHEDKIEIHFFIMDFSQLPEFRFLSFKERTQRWANMEQTIFNNIFNKNVELNEIKEETINSIRTGFIEISQSDIKYRMTFFYTQKFGIMIMLKANEKKYFSAINDIKLIIQNFKSNF